MKLNRLIPIIKACFATSILGAAPYSHDSSLIEELRIRDGLPNFYHKLDTQKEVRIAYLGGSITRAEGWRVKSHAWLEEQYPEIDFFHINAAVGGTGSDIGACRLEDYVLAEKPDLLFVEYRVNASGKYPQKGIEGIIRRTWESNPETDICLVYTLGIWMVDELSQGQQTAYGKKMEDLANYYGIPSIDFGVEVIKQLNAGTLSFQSPKREQGKLWFTKDPCHPTDEGHDLYRDIVARSFQKMAKHSNEKTARIMPSPIHEDHQGRAYFQSIKTAKLSGNWQAVDTKNDALYTSNLYRTESMLGESIKTSEVGASFTVEWEGTNIAFTEIPKGVGTEVQISIDGGAPITFKSDQKKKTQENYTSRAFYLPDQMPGKHNATLTVMKLPEGVEYYAGQFMVLNP